MTALAMSSPRAWGCFPEGIPPLHRFIVFPTCVGVFPGHWTGHPVLDSLPHVRGGVSLLHPFRCNHEWSSPRAWGCFPTVPGIGTDVGVFPTCVGVFPLVRIPHDFTGSLPHVRGGVSLQSVPLMGETGSSPRAWGCFRGRALLLHHGRVFPTCVGVFLLPQHAVWGFVGLPHVRGGVSTVDTRG